MSNEIKYCEKCGTAYTVGEKYCGNCGADLIDHGQTIGVFPHQEKKVPDTNKVVPLYKNKTVVISAIALVIVILSIIIIGITVNNNSSKKETETVVSEQGTNEKEKDNKNKPKDTEETTVYSKGTVTKDSYKSEFVNLQYKTPENWIVRTEEEIKALVEPQFAEQVAKTTDLSTFNVVSDENIQITIEDLPGKNADINTCINKSVTELNLMEDWSVVSSDKTIDFNGNTYNIVEAEMNIDGILTLKTESWMRVKNGKLINIILQYIDGNRGNVEKALNAFSPVSEKTSKTTETVDGLYLSYESSSSKKPFMINNSVFVTKESSKAGSSWKYVEDKEEIITYFNLAASSGAENVVCLIASEPGSMKGATYEIDEVVKGYEAGTWTFDDAEEIYNKEADN